MVDFNAARKNMVDCQIQTSGVTNPAILDAFRTVPREKFVPEKLRGFVFADEDLMLDHGEFLIEPMVLSRMLQAAQPGPSDKVLIVGDSTGYSAAIVSSLAGNVVSLETRMRELDTAKSVWNSIDCRNISVISGAAAEGAPANVPYDLIVIHGAVSQIPPRLLAQLSKQGRLVAVVRPQSRQAGCITLVARDGEQAFSLRRTYDAGTPYLKGFEPALGFIF